MKNMDEQNIVGKVVRKEIDASRYHVHIKVLSEQLDAIRGQDVSADQKLKIISPTSETPSLMRARPTGPGLDSCTRCGIAEVSEVPVLRT